MTDEIVYALMELSGQEYVDVYASSMKGKPADRLGVGAATDTLDAA